MRLTLGRLRTVIREALLPIKQPQTLKQKQAMIELIHWVSDRMMAPEADVEKALQKAQHDDWAEAMDLLSTYYFMKGIHAPKQKSN